MATQAYYNWDSAGRPWEVAVPIKATGDRLKAHGYTVYYLGADDPSHLQADVPEDHCPFSRTPWPGPQPYPYVLAMDVMPPTPGQRSKLDGQPLPSLQQISAQMRADKIAGHPGMAWLKYMNWEPQRNGGGECWHDSWQPTYARRASSDRGHTHMSGRTDHVTSTASTGYDPVIRARGEDDTVIESSGHGQVVMGRVEALTLGYDTVRYGPTAGTEPVWLVRAIKALGTAVGQVDEAVAAQLADEFAALDAEVAAARAELGQVDEAVIAALPGQSDAELAQMLEGLLGSERLQRVAQLAAQG